MDSVLVDSNVILDVVTEDPQWYEWSAAQLERLAEGHLLAINPIIYSEISIGFDRIEDLDQAVPLGFFRRDPCPGRRDFLQENVFSNTATLEANAARLSRIFTSVRTRRSMGWCC